MALDSILILLVYQLAGEIAVRLLGIPIPGPVLGMVLLFGSMLVFRPAAERVEKTGAALLENLGLLFVPAGVGVVMYLSLIGTEWLPITASLILSTMVAILVTAGIMVLCLKKAEPPASDSAE
jgi:holin-like protein